MASSDHGIDTDADTDHNANVESPHPAQDRVLGTTELHELILLHLPIQDLLLRVQRVSRAWRDLIAGSPALQFALFLRAEPGPVPYHLHGETSMETEIGAGNENATDAGTGTSAAPPDTINLPGGSGSGSSSGSNRQRAPPDPLRLRLNPLLQRPFIIGWESRADGTQKLWLSMRDEFRESLLEHRQATWRRMLLMQPPHPYEIRCAGEVRRIRGRRVSGTSVSLPVPGHMPVGEAVEKGRGFWRSRLRGRGSP
ncbi:hypothetical protein H2199_000446 [Coniosporium tulheliwenetii]|uniref:Uncharacterized protein n=1 Tax=Coniosporium tulheliwenetii TaxID=3383036 RepID=A0ACC2ZPY3_9PEZI|nr:hypothetical protein H2199_000446 [Cladosporium sp. JES 115]